MGSTLQKNFTHPTTTPSAGDMPMFDPMYGFPDGRPLYKPPLTREQLNDAQVNHRRRDLCVLEFLKYRECISGFLDYFSYKCSVPHAIFERCQREDFINRAKEFERERRLLVRRERILNKMAKEAAKAERLAAREAAAAAAAASASDS